jgi:hypothetical protein
VWNNTSRCCDSRDDKGEMTWVVGDDNPRWINSKDFNDRPSPLKGNGKESHTNHKACAFDMFLLLEKYRNNVGFNSMLDLASNSKDLHFMVLLMCKHNTNAQAQMHKLCNTWQHKQDTTKFETKAQ